MAVTAFRKAIPEIEKSESATPGLNLLARLHAAQAANAAKDYSAALEFAQPIIDNNPDWDFASEARFEIAMALKGQNKLNEAKQEFEKIVDGFDHVAARARFMVGQILFGQQDYESAIKQFKLVLYGYGGTQASDETKHWQALSAYEAARCSYVRINETNDANVKRMLGSNAKQMFQLYLERFPNHDFSEEAQKGVSVLEKLGY